MSSDARGSGRNTFLLVLPTGTGKAEIFIEDIVRLKEQETNLKTLILNTTAAIPFDVPQDNAAPAKDRDRTAE